MAKKKPAETKDQPLGTYIVRSNVQHDGDDYEPGDEIELTEKQAEALGAVVALAPAAQEAKADSTGKEQ